MAEVTGWKLVGTGANVARDTNNKAWSNPTYIQTTANYASAALDAFVIPYEGAYSQYLRSYNFGFTTTDIPTGSTIVGIEVKFTGYASAAAKVRPYLKLYSGTALVGNIKTGSELPAADGEQTLGGAADMWGSTLDGATIRGSGFGAYLWVLNTDTGSARTAYIKTVYIRVHYIALPTAILEATSSIQSTSAQANGKISDDGGADCQARFRHAEVLARDDFEWGANNDDITTSGGKITWTKSVAGTSTALISTAQKYGGTRSLKLYRDGTNDSSAAFTHTAALGYELEAMVYRVDNNSRSLFYHGSASKMIRVRVIESTGELGYYSGSFQGSGVTLDTGKWYKITIKHIDWGKGTFSIFLNDNFVQFGAMPADTWLANTVRLWSNAGSVASTMYFDDVVVRDIGVVESDNFEWGNNGDPLSDSGGDITWSITATGDAKADISTAKAYSGTRSARFLRSTTDANARMSHTPVSEGYRFRVMWITGARFVLYHGNGSKRILFHIGTAGQVYYRHADAWHQIGTVTTDVWTHFEFRNIAWNDGLFDVYQNGTLLPQAKLETSSGSANVIDIGSYWGNGTIYVDDFTIFEDWTLTDWQPETATLDTDDTYNKSLTGLTEGTDYAVATKAKNSAGEGAWSASGYFTTLRARRRAAFMKFF